MLSAVNLNDESMLLADEIDNERTNRRLAPEAQSIEPVCAQRRPQATLRIRHFMAQ
jgi:hypothetical protein